MAKIILEECPNCGSKNQNNKKYCDYCGSLMEEPLEEIAASEQDKSSAVQVNSDYNPDNNIQTSSIYSQSQDSQEAAREDVKQLKTTSGLAIASFVLAFFPIFWIISLILGIIANVSISKPDSSLTGKGFSTAAIIMSALGILTGIIIIIVIIASGVALGAMDSSY